MNEERTLVSQVLSGDLQAFRELIRRHERLVLHMIGRIVKSEEEREELCQDVFMRVYDKLKDFSFQSKLSTWIATIAYRHAINWMRKRKLPITDLADEDLFTAAFVEEENPESLLSDQDMNSFVMTLVEALPAQYKTILTLYHVESMHYDEIAKVTGLPEGTVKSYLFRARHQLKEKVKKYIGKEELL